MAFNRKYTHLFFDLDNTLWDFDKNAKLAMRDTIAELQLEPYIANFDAFYEFYESINTQLWEDYRKQQIRKPELIVKRFSDTLTHYQVPGIDPIAMNDRYLHHMARQHALIAGARELLQELRSREYHLQIITNGFKEVQLNKLKNCGIEGYFEHVFISEVIEYPKPHPKIFEHAIKSSNAPKSKSIMIGDNWETDIKGAKAFGIDQVYFGPTEQIPVQTSTLNGNPDILSPKTGKAKTFCIDNLTNILLIV